MISNSVLHLHTAELPTPQLPKTPLQYRHKLRVIADVAAPSADISAWAPISSHQMKTVRAFHDVSQCFKCFMMFYKWFTMYQCFTCVSYFTMFNNVLWYLESRAMIGNCAAAARRFWKSTHISMISNSVTHLRSYTNSAIAANFAPILPTSPHPAPISPHQMTSAQSQTSLPQTQTSPYRAPTFPYRVPISSHRMPTVSQCFKCFMMFY